MRIPILAALAAVLAGGAYGFAARLVFSGSPIIGYGAMSLAFVVLVPAATGFLVIALAPAGRRRVARYVALPALTSIACLACVLAAGVEGFICAFLVLPAFLVFATLGGIMAGGARRRVPNRRAYAAVVAAVLLLPYAAALVEDRVSLPDARRTVVTRVRIRADAATAWRNIVRPTGIRPEENQRRLAQRIGFPLPVTATLSREALGGSRFAIFERGVMLRETVTEWVPERRMAFLVDPASIPARVLDEHVTIGGPFFDVLDGFYQIVSVAPGEVELRLVTTHRLSTHFNPYAGFWTDLLMRQIQENLLHVVRTRSEAGR